MCQMDVLKNPKTVLVITETDPSDVLILPLMMVLSDPREKTDFDSVIVRAHRGLGGH